jgi:hypothetical protein
MLDKKLQLKGGQSIAVVGGPTQLELAAERAAPDDADAVLVFAADRAQLLQHLGDLKQAAEGDKLTWVAYPKEKRLDTDLNRDIVRSIANENGLDPVRQVAVDETWSALRLKPYSE